MATVVSSRARLGRLSNVRIDVRSTLLTCVVLVVGFLVLYPIAHIVIQSVMVSAPGESPRWSLSGWEAILSERPLQSAVWNTLTVTLTRQSISLVFGIFIAWLLARTDVPGGRVFEFIFWLAFSYPA